jgi:hypothetical protein
VVERAREIITGAISDAYACELFSSLAGRKSRASFNLYYAQGCLRNDGALQVLY